LIHKDALVLGKVESNETTPHDFLMENELQLDENIQA
jgi:hypothetical protein